MARRHTIAEGEHVVTVAARFGFRNWRTIWEHPDNAALRAARVNPFTLVPGDVLVVPERAARSFEVRTGAVHAFTLEFLEAALNLRLLRADAAPFGERPTRIRTGAGSAAGDPATFREDEPKTDQAGKLGTVISELATQGELTVMKAPETAGQPPAPEHTYRLLIGLLQPVNSIAGQQARLQNLGYFAGFTKRDLRQLTWAIEEFEFDHGLPVRGRPDNPAFFNRLGHEHGDLLPGEKASLPLVDGPPP